MKWKRVDLLMDVFAKLLKQCPIAKLTIVGTGPELDNLKQQAKDLGIEEHVECAGAVYERTQVVQ